jgi:hypothetical protein
MGGSVSSLHRLRNRFIINLYKQGLVDERNTITSIFDNIGFEVDGVKVITKSQLSQLIGIESINILEELCNTCRFQNECIPVNFITDFIENGFFANTAMEAVKKQINSDSMDSEVRNSLGLLPSSDADNSTALTKYKAGTMTDETDFKQKSLPENKPLCKKHETVIQERIVRQITVDGEGNMNELITTDKSQNDIIHIESKETGEFAHREYTQQEQTEELDKEIATFVRATEEYIHLKSKEDEYEYLHSEVPPQAEEDLSEDECESIDKSLMFDEDNSKSYQDQDEELDYVY